MFLQSIINSITGRSKLEGLASEIADSCSKLVWQKVESRMHSMTGPQARGYIRAKAGRTVRLQLNHALRRNLISPRQQSKLLKMTMDALTHTLLQAHYRQRVTPVEQRRAA